MFKASTVRYERVGSSWLQLEEMTEVKCAVCKKKMFLSIYIHETDCVYNNGYFYAVHSKCRSTFWLSPLAYNDEPHQNI